MAVWRCAGEFQVSSVEKSQSGNFSAIHVGSGEFLLCVFGVGVVVFCFVFVYRKHVTRLHCGKFAVPV